jgi:hypothetical protein
MNLITLTVLLVSILNNTFTNGDPAPVQISEKAYLHIDRVLHNSGDDIWFKAYVIDPSTNKLSINTNNLHVELISPGSEIIQRRIIRIEGGVGNGDFHLTDSVPSGQYRIRAYTNRMRNFDDRLFFLKEIFIINPIDEGQELNRPVHYTDDKIEISFFPEGGSLVDNVASVVAFKAVDASGKGCDVTGELFSSEGDLITSFKSTHKGMGFFTLKPAPGLSYYVIAKKPDGTTIKTGLPASFSKGVTISAFVTLDKELLLTVNTNAETLPSLTGRDLALAFSLPSMITRITNITINSLVNNFLLPCDEFPNGIIRVTLSGIEGLPLGERLVYIQKNNDVYLNAVTDKEIYQPREKISAVISLSGDSSFSGKGFLSFSAAEAKSANNSSSFPTTIASWFLLESDVHGPVEEPSYYFDPVNKNRLADLDLLLLTQGWRDFQWKYDSLLPFIHEIGFTLSGRVKRLYGNNPVAGAKINLGIFGKMNSRFFDTETDPEGVFKFDELDYTGWSEIFVSATGKNERMQGRIFIDSTFYEPPETGGLTINLPELVLVSENYSALKQEAVVNLAIKKKYKLSDTIDIGEVFITASRPDTPQEVKIKESRKFYGTPDKEFVVPLELDNFPGDVFDIIAGRIPGVSVIRSDTNVSVKIRNQGGGALIVLDGRQLDPDFPEDINYVLTIPVFMIDRIDVLNSSVAYGMKGANGVISIITRTEMRRGPEVLSANAASIKMKGYDASRIFYSPRYNSPENLSYTPDTRTTIFWEPYITIEKNGSAKLEYFNTDNPASINITVEGITEEGIPVSGKTRYEVK